MSASKQRWIADALALAVSLAPAVYASLRVLRRALGPEPDPAAMLWTERSLTLDRLTLTLYATALISTGTAAVTRKFSDKMDSLLIACAALSALALFAQGALSP